ncbi:MAG: hypothetical protein QM570_18685 [Planctomycetota bacterium]|nr:hypothetical protein [Planctomycetota bacterium]
MDAQPKRPTEDTTPQARQAQYEIYRTMPAARKLELVFETYHMGRRLATAGLRMQNPHATAEEIWHLWARRHLGADSYDRAYGVMSYE